jgi:hypothetical protein
MLRFVVHQSPGDTSTSVLPGNRRHGHVMVPQQLFIHGIVADDRPGKLRDLPLWCALTRAPTAQEAALPCRAFGRRDGPRGSFEMQGAPRFRC